MALWERRQLSMSADLEYLPRTCAVCSEPAVYRLVDGAEVLGVYCREHGIAAWQRAHPELELPPTPGSWVMQLREAFVQLKESILWTKPT